MATTWGDNAYLPSNSHKILETQACILGALDLGDLGWTRVDVDWTQVGLDRSWVGLDRTQVEPGSTWIGPGLTWIGLGLTWGELVWTRV